MDQSGFIKLHRKLYEWGWYSDSQMVHLFIHLLLKANYKDAYYKGILVKRGQLIFGRKATSKTLGISERSIRTCMTRLKSTSELTIKTTNRFSLVTIVKYEDYQLETEKTTNKTTNKTTSNRPATDQQPTTYKEYNNNNTNNTMSGRADRFVEFVNSTFSKHYRCTEKVKSHFNARMRDYSPEILLRVVNNIKNSSYHIDTGFKYATPEFLLREDKIEKYKSGPINDKILKTQTPEPKPNQKYDENTNIYAEFE